jgi:hypothetical protein
MFFKTALNCNMWRTKNEMKILFLKEETRRKTLEKLRLMLKRIKISPTKALFSLS